MPIVTILLDFGNIVPKFSLPLFWRCYAIAVHDFYMKDFQTMPGSLFRE